MGTELESMNRSLEPYPAAARSFAHGAIPHPLIEFLKRNQTELSGRLKSFNSLIDAGESLDEIGQAARRLLAAQAHYVDLRSEALFPSLERALGQELPFIDSFLNMWSSQTALLEQVADRAAREDRPWSARRGKELIGLARDLMWKEANILFLVLERAFSHRAQVEIVESIVRHATRNAGLCAQPLTIPA